MNHWKGCSLSGCTKIELLIASHIKPWRDCDTNEAIDPMNSLLLMPNYDALFDKGFITFCDRGKIKLSPHLDETTAKIFGINPNMALRETCRGHIPFLTYHRENVFRSKI
ncbi:HNH endonuclease [Shewanella sp. SR43-8]|uniref:HNH endonuclease n=1 Tax=Shewanella sp. SR43-8 TaxID=2760938 RepID=UPI002873F3AD|nr:HNH endonuclease [Shewanella sp. SR43-8]